MEGCCSHDHDRGERNVLERHVGRQNNDCVEKELTQDKNKGDASAEECGAGKQKLVYQELRLFNHELKDYEFCHLKREKAFFLHYLGKPLIRCEYRAYCRYMGPKVPVYFRLDFAKGMMAQGADERLYQQTVKIFTIYFWHHYKQNNKSIDFERLILQMGKGARDRPLLDKCIVMMMGTLHSGLLIIETPTGKRCEEEMKFRNLRENEFEDFFEEHHDYRLEIVCLEDVFASDES
jgi:hypothetical protein